MTYLTIPLDPECKTAFEGVMLVIDETCEDEDRMDASLVNFAVMHRQECERCRTYAAIQPRH